MREDSEGIGTNKMSADYISQRFELFNRVFATRLAEAYQAKDLNSGEYVLLWITKYPVSSSLEERTAFVERIKNLQFVSELGVQVRECNVLEQGKGFVVLDYVEAVPLLKSKVLEEEGDKVFASVVKIVGALHRRNIVLGDIGEQTFAINNEGDVLLVGVAGFYTFEADATTVMPAVSMLYFLSPEQREGNPANKQSDIFALGMLGYRIFTGRYPYGENRADLGNDDVVAIAQAPSLLNYKIPVWVDGILSRCLDSSLEQRYLDAEVLQGVVKGAMRTGESGEGPGAWSKKTLMVHPQYKDKGARTKIDPQESQFEAQEPEEEVAPNKGQFLKVGMFPLLAAGVLFFGVLTFLGAFLLLESFDLFGGGNKLEESPLGVHAAYASESLKRNMELATDTSLSMPEREKALRAISESDDPVTFSVLLLFGTDPAHADMREFAERLIIHRVEQSGFARTSRFIERWSSEMKGRGLDPLKSKVYGFILRASDGNLPLPTRQEALHKIYTTEPLFAAQLAAALSLDVPEQEAFSSVVRQFVVKQLGVDSVEQKSPAALILSHRSLSSMFADEIGDRMEQMSSEDLLWAMEHLASSNSPALTDVLTIVLEKKILPPFQSVFLATLLDTSSGRIVPSQVKAALVRGAKNSIEKPDIGALGRWMALESQDALLAVMALSDEKDVALEAFDTLAAKSVTREPAASLLDWIRTNYWDYRGKLIKAVGILGHFEIASEDQINHALDLLVPFAGRTSLMKVVLGTNNPDLITKTLARLEELIPSKDLITLLGHQNKEVRVAAVRGLAGRNDLSVLQAVVKAYEREKEEDVRALYQELHWVTRDRS